ncbi:uncharacterized protein [Anabrus simplex]|uniref:uncharacterized protein isoform X2 n=1 Tax=Anabrus simplex TaxID=316456 RepID=UPI0035A3D315
MSGLSVCLNTDPWTSRNTQRYLAVTAIFTNHGFEVLVFGVCMGHFKHFLGIVKNVSNKNGREESEIKFQLAMSDCMDDEYDEEEEESTKLEDEGSGGGGTQEKDEKVFDSSRQLKLKFPVKGMPGKEEIMALHPDITDVEIPRKVKHPRYCWAEFATREKAEKALEDLLKMRLEGGQYIEVTWKGDPSVPNRLKKDPDNNKRWIMVSGIPHDARVEEFKDSVVGLTLCIMGRKRSRRRVPLGSVLLVFNCVKHAMEYFEDKKQHVYRGRPVKVRFLYADRNPQSEEREPNPQSEARKPKRQKTQERSMEYGQRPAAYHGNNYGQERTEYEQRPAVYHGKNYGQERRTEYEQRPAAYHGNNYGQERRAEYEQRPAAYHGNNYRQEMRAEYEQRPAAYRGNNYGQERRTEYEQRPAAYRGNNYM